MASKYDSIKTAADLITEVRCHGLSTTTDDINRAADIFGNSAVKELITLANDIGRNNEKGEPDPKGTWSSSRPATQGTFYQIAFVIWSWEQATAFYNQYTLKIPKIRQEVKFLDRRVGEEADRANRLQTSLEFAEDDLDTANNEISDLRTALADANNEINELKAKLYDYMTGAA